jgi:hypothetical protein
MTESVTLSSSLKRFTEVLNKYRGKGLVLKPGGVAILIDLMRQHAAAAAALEADMKSLAWAEQTLRRTYDAMEDAIVEAAARPGSNVVVLEPKTIRGAK